MPIDLRQITRRFGPVVANRDVDLTIRDGEVHALLGENGAGKSTLMHILAGLLRPDAGEILVEGHPLPVGSPRAARAAGIWMVHQHFMLVGPLTVEENLRLSFDGPPADLRRRVLAAAERYGLEVDLAAQVEDLPVGSRQRVELLKAIIQESRYLILDEPTAVLAESEVGNLLALLRALAEQGRAVVLITHKVAEVMQAADTVTVLRNGEVAGRFDPKQSTADELVTAVIGGSLHLPVRLPHAPGDVALTIDDGPITVQVHRGEVFGIAGVDGNGQFELSEQVAGLRSGRRIHHTGKVGYIPQDRMLDGLAGPFSVAENLALRSLVAGRAVSLPGRRSLLQTAGALIAEYDIRPPLPWLPVERLSGGNQQKVVLARELSLNPELLVAVQPTRGLDPAATAFVQERILQAAARGTAVLYVSTDLDELFRVADRIGVMYRGRIIGIAELQDGRFRREEIGAWMTGVVA